MSRRATELQQGIQRAHDRVRYAQRLLDACNGNYPGSSEAEQRTRRKLGEDVDRAKNDAAVLSRMLRELVPL